MVQFYIGIEMTSYSSWNRLNENKNQLQALLNWQNPSGFGKWQMLCYVQSRFSRKTTNRLMHAYAPSFYRTNWRCLISSCCYKHLNWVPQDPFYKSCIGCFGSVKFKGETQSHKKDIWQNIWQNINIDLNKMTIQYMLCERVITTM